MELNDILDSLERIDLPEEGGRDDLVTVSDTLRKMIELGEKVGRSEYRTSQNAEHIAEQLDRLDSQLRGQLEVRETEVRDARQKVGELEEEVQRLVIGLIQIADLVDAAGRAVPENDTAETGMLVDRLHSEIDKVARRLGLEALAHEGEPHDPEFHEPVATDRVAGRDRHQIIEVVRQGYRYNGRVVRVAKVVIAE